MRKHSLASTCALLVFPLLASVTAEASLTPFAGLPSAGQDRGGGEARLSALPQPGSVIALDRDVSLHGGTLLRGTELIVGENGELAMAAPDSGEELVLLPATIAQLDPADWTALTVSEESGELEPYYLANDLDFAGPGRGRGKRRGTTNCYHVVKQLVRHRITLTGVAAYMAAPQLRAAGWTRYDFASAPRGSVCVFGAGGRHTASGGHIYGHVGVKGAGGIANPQSGFHLNRPFLGCWHE